MKKLALVTTSLILLTASAAFAKTYPVVGKVTEITANKITLQAANKKTWEINRDATTKVPANVKVGSIVVVQTNLTAADVVDKTPKAAAAAPAAAAPVAAAAKKQ